MLAAPRCLFALFVSAVVTMNGTHALALPAASPLTEVSIVSLPGDYVTEDQAFLYHPNDSKITVFAGGASVVEQIGMRVDVGRTNFWDFSFRSPNLGEELKPGTYYHAGSQLAWPGRPEVEILHNSDILNVTDGTFTVLSAKYTYVGTQAFLESLALKFSVLFYDSKVPLTGYLYFRASNIDQLADSSYPTTAISTSGVIGKMGRFNGPVTVSLAASDPDGQADVASTTYSLDDGAPILYRKPFVVRGDALHKLEFHSVDRSGNQEPSQRHDIYIDSTGLTNDPLISELKLNSDPDNYIIPGKSYDYSKADGNFACFSGYKNVVGFEFFSTNSSVYWSIGLNAPLIPDQNLTLGMYPNVLGGGNEENTHSGIDISGPPINNMTTSFVGDFTILDYTSHSIGRYIPQPQIDSFAATFNYYKRTGGPGLHGVMYDNSQAYVKLISQHLLRLDLPEAIAANGTATGSVTLARPADRGGQYVTLLTSDTATVNVPQTVFVAPGTISANFVVMALKSPGAKSVVVSADGDGVVKSGTVLVGTLPAPIFNVAPGTYKVVQQVSLSDSIAGSVIRFTVDGSAPTSNSPIYTGPIKIARTTTIRAISQKAGWSDSAVASSVYTINPGIVFPAGLAFFCLPYDYDGTAPAPVFGLSEVKIAAWISGEMQYAVTPVAPADSIRLGTGYWARFPKAVAVHIAGATANSTSDFAIPLAQGWNAIGNPFTTAVPVSMLTFGSGAISFANASSGGGAFIRPTMYSYNSVKGSYEPATSGDTLVPFKGYWIFANAATTLRVPAPLK